MQRAQFSKDVFARLSALVGMLLPADHPSFPTTANTSCSIRASFLQISIFKLPYQNVRTIRGNCLFIATLFLIHVLCCIKVGFLGVCAVCFWPDVGACTGGCFCLWRVPGWGLQGSRVVPCAGGTMLSHMGWILLWQVVRVVPEAEQLPIRV